MLIADPLFSTPGPRIIDCRFIGNRAQGGGGAVHVFEAKGTSFVGCQFLENEALDSPGGGAVWVSTGDEGAGGTGPTFQECEFRANSARADSACGGAVAATNFSSPQFVNCLFVGNDAEQGGALSSFSSAPGVTNCTFVNNQAVVGGAIIGGGFFNASVANSILWGNSPEQIFDQTDTIIVTYSDIEGGWPGVGNIDCDPLFADLEGGDFQPLAACVIDAGDNCAVPEGIETDLDANPRFVDYPGAANVGSPGCQGGEDIVDMGAYERQCPADCDGNATLNVLDFVCYQQLFQSGDGAADCNADGMLNILDFVCFQGLFQAGCE